MVASIPVLVGEREVIGVFGVLCGWELVLNYTMSLGSLLISSPPRQLSLEPPRNGTPYLGVHFRCKPRWNAGQMLWRNPLLHRHRETFLAQQVCIDRRWSTRRWFSTPHPSSARVARGTAP